MNIFSSTILLALLSGIDLSLSFLAHPRRRPFAGSANAASVRVSSAARCKSRLFCRVDRDENFPRVNGGARATSGGFLRRAVGDAPRGGGGGGASDSGGAGANGGVYRALSVAELKRLLNDRGVDHRDCFEKRDLVERLMSTRGLAPPSSASYSDDGGGLSREENRVVNTFTEASPAVAFIQTISQQQVVRRGFSLRGTEVPTGAGSGFLWDDRVS